MGCADNYFVPARLRRRRGVARYYGRPPGESGGSKRKAAPTTTERLSFPNPYLATPTTK
jgi:hypothetical protein